MLLLFAPFVILVYLQKSCQFWPREVTKYKHWEVQKLYCAKAGSRFCSFWLQGPKISYVLLYAEESTYHIVRVSTFRVNIVLIECVIWTINWWIIWTKNWANSKVCVALMLSLILKLFTSFLLRKKEGDARTQNIAATRYVLNWQKSVVEVILCPSRLLTDLVYFVYWEKLNTY